MLKRFTSIAVLAFASLGSFPALSEPQGQQTIFVAATGSPNGSGTNDSPFVLSAGREYDLNHLIRSATDAGKDVEVIFASGTYHDVRLQIIKQGIDSDSFYNLEPGPDASGKQTMIFGKPYHYRSYARCNNQGMNCRVQPADYALGPHSSARVVLKSAELHQAIFDGKDFQINNPDITNHALVVEGAYTNVIETGQKDVKTEPIKNIAVTGFVFRNYQNGIFVNHGMGVTIDDCIVESIGTHDARTHDQNNYGVEGFSAKGDSELVLVKNSKIINAWNAPNSSLPGGKDWPGLMHAIYDGYSRDIIFINNEVMGSSGPIVKFGNYPIQKDGQIIYQYGDKTWERRGFFIGNQFVLAPIIDNGQTQPPYTPIEAFIHDNSQEKIGSSGVTSPTKGMVFLNNRFRNLLSGDAGSHVAFIRQELPSPGLRPDFPDFSFAGNVVEGVQASQLLVHRSRGTAVASDSVQSDDAKSLKLPLPVLNQPKVNLVDAGQTIDRLLAGTLKSPHPERDQLVSTIIRTGEIPEIP